MNRLRLLTRGTVMTAVGLGIVAAITSLATHGGSHARAADHIDGPSAILDPPADLTDLFVWMSPDGSRLNLVADTFHSASDDAAHSPATQYVFHVESGAAYGATSDETLVICQFYDVERIECWAGDEYVEGDPSDPAGITSESGRMRVFAGLRDDPFFMEYAGFLETVDLVIEAAPNLTFDAEQCPILSSEVQTALATQLQTGANGEPPTDTFEQMNVLSLVVQLDPEIVATNGSVLAVWASTHAAPVE